MQLNDFDEKIHSIKILQITIVTCFYFFIVENLFYSTISFVLTLVFMVWAGVNLKKALKIFMASVVFGLTFFLVVLLFPNKGFENSEKFQFLHLMVSKRLFDQQLHVFMRIVFISTTSVMSAYLIKYEKVFIYLMKKKKLPVNIGYPLILAFNSLGALRSELEKITINAKLRGIPFLQRINILFPLLVYSIRHAERGALTLITRGMNEDKSFYFDIEVSFRDELVTIFIIVIHLVLVGFYFYTLK